MTDQSRQLSIVAAVPDAVERLRREFAPLAIYQFGSSVSGNAGPSSDLDLLVVVDQSAEDFITRTQRGYLALLGVAVPVDVLVYTREEFGHRAGLPISLERTVQSRGRLVYAA